MPCNDIRSRPGIPGPTDVFKADEFLCWFGEGQCLRALRRLKQQFTQPAMTLEAHRLAWLEAHDGMRRGTTGDTLLLLLGMDNLTAELPAEEDLRASRQLWFAA